MSNLWTSHMWGLYYVQILHNTSQLLLFKFETNKGCLRPEDVSDDEKLSRTIKIIAVSKFIKEIVRMAANLNLSLIHI